MPFSAETIRGYLGADRSNNISPTSPEGRRRRQPAARRIETRFRYNQDFDSIYAMVPPDDGDAARPLPGDSHGARDRA